MSYVIALCHSIFVELIFSNAPVLLLWLQALFDQLPIFQMVFINHISGGARIARFIL